MAKAAAKSKPPQSERPQLYRYHDYRLFLKDWLAWKKAGQSAFSLRRLGRLSGLASGYLPMVLSGQRELSGKALAQLLPHLGLTETERSFLEKLVSLGTTDSPEARLEALDRMGRFTQYQKESSRESEVYRYLTHWYYVAIREMAGLPGFRPEPEWVQARLQYPVPLQEIRAALAFLVDNQYIVPTAGNPEGAADAAETATYELPEKALNCSGGVYRIALGQFHRELLELAGRSIEETPSTKRNIQGHTVALGAGSFEKARRILEDAIARIRELGENEQQGEDIYHFEAALFPLTGGSIQSRREKK